MNCRKCGNVLHESSTSCPFCGEVITRRKNSQESSTQIPNPPTEVLEENNLKPPMMPPNNKIEQNDINQPREKKSSFSFIIAILVIAILGAGCFMGYKYINKESATSNNKANTNENNEPSTENNQKDNDTEDNKQDDETEPNIEKETKYFEISGYKFPIPSNLDYDSSSKDNTLILSDKNNFRTAISFDVGDYETYEFDPEQTIKDLEETGYTITNNTTQTINEVEYYLYEGSYEESPILAFTYKLDNNIIIIGAIVSNDTTSFEKVLEYISEMIKGVEKTSTTNPSTEEETPPDISLDINSGLLENNEN